MVSGWIQCLFHPSNKSTANLFSLKLAGQCAAGADCGYCHCQHSRPVHPDKKHLGPKGGLLDLPPGTGWHKKTLLASNISRSKSALLKILSLFKGICDCSLGGRGFKEFLILKMFHVILVDDS